jgi:hypothetical protein
MLLPMLLGSNSVHLLLGPLQCNNWALTQQVTNHHIHPNNIVPLPLMAQPNGRSNMCTPTKVRLSNTHILQPNDLHILLALISFNQRIDIIHLPIMAVKAHGPRPQVRIKHQDYVQVSHIPRYPKEASFH